MESTSNGSLDSFQKSTLGKVLLGVAATASVGAFSLYLYRQRTLKKIATEARFYENDMSDFSNSAVESLRENSEEYEEKVKRKMALILAEIESNFSPEKAVEDLNESVYLGSCGLAFFYWKLYSSETEDINKRQHYLDVCLKYLDATETIFEKKAEMGFTCPDSAVSFLFGKSGLYALRALTFHALKDEEKSEAALQSFLDLSQFARDENRQNIDFCFGTVGYLYGCLFLRQYLPSFPLDHILPVWDFLVRKSLDQWEVINGKKYEAEREKLSRLASVFPSSDLFPLMDFLTGPKLGWKHSFMKPLFTLMYYVFYGRKTIEMYGMGHGTAAIPYYLLGCPELVHSNISATVSITNTLQYLMKKRTPNGNYPAGFFPAQIDDKIVHWCHGAPGMIFLFTKAYQVLDQEKYLQAAERASDVVWERGLLRKGAGICHGIAGNGYSFLNLYNVSKQEKYLYRAQKFAEFICREPGDPGYVELRKADNPYSLWEGTAGTYLYLRDVLAAQNNGSSYQFPCFADYEIL